MASRDLVVHIIGDDRSLQRAYKRSTDETQKFERSMSRTVRGAAAGSGVFRSLGRSIAFASGGFLAAASITDVLRGSINQATEAAKVQRQLAAQFKVAGQNLEQYQQQIDETTNKLSALAGFENDELKAAFVTAFRGTENVSTALKIQAIAADVARARGIGLSVATLALTKAYGGQSTALRRLGILVPPTLRGYQALNFVQQKFAGQAKAGTTDQERFTAAFKNTEEIIGTALLPAFNKLLTGITDWLVKGENQKRVQRDVTEAVSTFTTVVGDAAEALRQLSRPLGGVKNLLKLLGTLFLGLKIARLATEVRGLAGAWGLVASLAWAAAAPAAAAAGGAVLPRGFGGPLGLGAAAGAALAFGQRGETSAAVATAVGTAQVLNNLVSYRDPVTGKFVMFEKRSSETVAAAIRRDLRKRHPELMRPAPTGEDVAQRGAGARTGRPAGGVAGAGGAGLSLQGQMNMLETRLAQALTTTSKADDRAILVLQRNLLGRMLASTKDWQKRRQLYQNLASVQDQIRSIDEDAAQKEKDAQDKKLTAEKNRLEAHREHIRAMRAAWQEQLQAIRDAADQVRGEFGGLPFQPTQAGILGVRGQSAGGLVAAYLKQTKDFVRFYNDLFKLRKMGAQAGLISQLRGLGPEGAGLVRGLVTHPGQLRQLIRSFGEREQVVQQIAKADIHARVVHLHMPGARPGATPAAQRRGRGAGIPVGG